MPSFVLGYVAGSGFTPLFSGNPWSGRVEPVGGLQIVSDKNNSGNIYVSLSGGNAFSGQISTLVGSGGPTITSGAMPISGGMQIGFMDGIPVGPGGAYFVPRLAIQNTGPNSGTFNICVGCDLACSGLARVYAEAF